MLQHRGGQILKTLRIFAVVSACFLTSTPVKATQVGEMIGVYRSGSDGYYLWVGDSWEGITKKWKDLGKDGLRLVDIERYVVDGKAKYAGVWRSGKGKHALWGTDSWSEFTKRWKDYSKNDLKLIDVETYVSGGKRHYLGVWRKGDYSTALWAGKGWDAFTKTWKDLSKKGQRLVDIEAYVSGNDTHYIGLFHKGSGSHFLWKADSWSGFVDKWKQLSKNKLRLVDLERIAEGNKFKYVGVYRVGTDGYLLYREKPEKFFAQWENFGDEDQRLVDLELVITGGKPAGKPPHQGKPVATRDCDFIGPYRITGKKKLKNKTYGWNNELSNRTKSSILSVEYVGLVKLVVGVCVGKGEVEHTLSYRGTSWRLNPLVTRLKAGQCKCYWKTMGWPYALSYKSIAEVKGSGTVYSHKASVCLKPWRKKCQIKTWEGWK